jgi:hypothetical protein
VDAHDLEINPGIMRALERSRWRVGGHVGRTIYAQVGTSPDRERDVLIGMLDTRELAWRAVADHNTLLEREA